MMGEIILRVMAWAAQAELESIKRRIEDGVRRAAEEGRFPGRPRALTPDQAAAIRQHRGGPGVQEDRWSVLQVQCLLEPDGSIVVPSLPEQLHPPVVGQGGPLREMLAIPDPAGLRIHPRFHTLHGGCPVGVHCGFHGSFHGSLRTHLEQRRELLEVWGEFASGVGERTKG